MVRLCMHATTSEKNRVVSTQMPLLMLMMMSDYDYITGPNGFIYR